MAHKKGFAHDVQHYLPLVSIFLAGIAGCIIFSSDKFFQASIIVATASAYVVWGIVHHYLHHDLQFSVVVEYMLIAALGLLITLSVLLQ